MSYDISGYLRGEEIAHFNKSHMPEIVSLCFEQEEGQKFFTKKELEWLFYTLAGSPNFEAIDEREFTFIEKCIEAAENGDIFIKVY